MRELVVGAVLQLDVELQIVLQARFGEVARTGDDAALVAVALVERHDVELGVNALGRIRADFQFAGLDPFHEFADAVFDFGTVAGFLELVQDFARQRSRTWAWDSKTNSCCFFGGLNQFVGRAGRS